MDYHVPADVPSGKLARPELDPHPRGTAAPQVESDSVALGVAYGENDPVTFPPVTVKLVIPGAPTTENAGGCVQGVGDPGGTSHLSLNFEAAVGTRERPLKTLEHLFAPAPVKINVPLIVPETAIPVVVTHGLDELPNDAFTVIFSVVAVPPLIIGGLNPIDPDQTPCVALQVTSPERGGGNGKAAPTPTAGTSVNPNAPAATTIARRHSFFIRSSSHCVELNSASCQNPAKHSASLRVGYIEMLLPGSMEKVEYEPDPHEGPGIVVTRTSRCGEAGVVNEPDLTAVPVGASSVMVSAPDPTTVLVLFL